MKGKISLEADKPSVRTESAFAQINSNKEIFNL